MGLKNNCVHARANSRAKEKQSQLRLLNSLEQKQCWEQKQGTAHAPLVGKPPKLPSSTSPGHTPTLTPNKKRAHSPSGNDQAREPVTCFHSLLQPA